MNSLFGHQRLRQIQSAVTLLLIIALLTLGSLSVVEGHSGVCSNLLGHFAGEHSECDHEHNVCASDAGHQHHSEYASASSTRDIQDSCFYAQPVEPALLPLSDSRIKSAARPLQKPDHLHCHATQVMLI